MTGTDQDAIDTHAALFGLHPLMVAMIHSRGQVTPESIDRFINPRYSDMHGPFEMRGMREAVSRLRRAIDNGEKIGIFADSDLDGITSLALLHECLKRFQIEPYMRYLTGDESYGMTDEIVNEFHRAGVSLVITVDAGTRDVKEIAHARALGIDVIVTDHHEEDDELPNAIVVNPRIAECSYPFKNLAGVGVAFKLCHALLISYLPSYGRSFCVVCHDDTGIGFASVRDYYVERIERSMSRDDLFVAINGLDEKATVIVHRDESILGYARKRGMICATFSEFIGMILSLQSASYESICDYLSMNREIYRESIGILVAILLEAQIVGSEKIRSFMDYSMGLVAIGSIADVVPLEGENRVLVKKGMDCLNRVRHPAISLVLNGNRVTGRSIGWTVAPLLNTPGRIGRTELTVRFFTEKDKGNLKRIVDEISGLNNDRRDFIAGFCDRVCEDIRDGRLDASGGIIDIRAHGIPEGYAGLIANRISDMTGKPVIVSVMPPRNGLVKGSGRSRGGMPFFSIVQELRGRFDRIGGHENAFGFTAPCEELDGILTEICSMVNDAPPGDREPASADCEVSVEAIDVGFIRQLEFLEPFGSGNPEPLFRSRGSVPDAFKEFGAGHGKYLFNRNASLTAIGWGMAEVMKDYFDSGKPLDLIFRLENNIFNGSVRPRMILNEVKYSSA